MIMDMEVSLVLHECWNADKLTGIDHPKYEEPKTFADFIKPEYYYR